jgi:hypothetical protein
MTHPFAGVELLDADETIGRQERVGAGGRVADTCPISTPAYQHRERFALEFAQRTGQGSAISGTQSQRAGLPVKLAGLVFLKTIGADGIAKRLEVCGGSHQSNGT